MKIKLEKGNKCETDQKIKIKTEGYEVFNLTRLLLVINQLALNEQKRYENAPNNKDELWFVQAVKRFMEDGYNYINLLEDKNEHLLENYTSKWKIPSSFKQTKISDFENESP